MTRQDWNDVFNFIGQAGRAGSSGERGAAAGLGLLTTPLALKAGAIALRWARRHPGMAVALGTGALVWYGMRSAGGAARGLRQAFGGRDPRVVDVDDYDFPGAAHGSIDRESGASTPSRSRGGPVPPPL